MRAAQAGANVAQSNADLARANTVQNIQFGPYYERDEFETVFFGFAAQMNLPIWDSGRPLARQREAECTQRVIGLNALRMRARVEIQTALDRYQQARALAEKERPNLSQSLTGDLDRVKRQFDVGQADILNVFATQTALLQEQKAYLDLLNELAQSAADVTLAAGLPPPGSSPNDPPTLPASQRRRRRETPKQNITRDLTVGYAYCHRPQEPLQRISRCILDFANRFVSPSRPISTTLSSPLFPAISFGPRLTPVARTPMSSAQRPGGWKTEAHGTTACRGRIVFHADDFGMNRAVTDGILRGFQHGLITATSLLANAPDAARAITRVGAAATHSPMVRDVCRREPCAANSTNPKRPSSWAST